MALAPGTRLGPYEFTAQNRLRWHSDLKAANIKVRDDGTVKVLNFGLAKVGEPGSRTGGSGSGGSPRGGHSHAVGNGAS